MNNSPSSDVSRRAATAWLLVISAVYAAVLLSCVRFGLPSSARMEAVYGVPALSDSTIVEMNAAWQTIANSGDALHTVLDQDSLYAAPRVDTQLERMRTLRRMALYTTEPDEMHVPLALGRMKPRQLDFNPHFFQYGGLLFYGCGAFIAAGGLLGFYPLFGGLDSFLRNPDAMGNLYTAGRLWIVLWTSFLPFFTYRLARVFMPRRSALLAVVLAAFTPGFLAFGPVMKQVALASSIGVAAAYAACRLARRDRLRDYALAGALAGLAGAAFVTHLILLAGVATVVIFRVRDGFRPAFQRLVLAGSVALAVFLVWNPYWLLDFRSVYADAVAAMNWYKPNVAVNTVLRVIDQVLPSATGGLLLFFGVGLAAWSLIAADLPRRTLAVMSLAVLGYYGYRITGVVDLGPIWCRQFIVLGPLWAVLFVDFLHRQVKGRFASVALAVFVCIVVILPKDVLIVRNFQQDSGTASTRFEAGRWIDANIPLGATIHVNQVAGPFSTPFFRQDRYTVLVTGRDTDVKAGDTVVTVGTANLYGNEAFFAHLQLVREIPSERNFIGTEYEETFGFANGPVRIWRK